MTGTPLNALLRHFRRQVLLIRLARMLLLAGTVMAVLWAATLPRPVNKQVIFLLFLAMLVLWALLLINTTRFARCVQTAGALMSIGQLDDAEVWIRRALSRFSLSVRTQLLACQQYASLYFRRDAHEQVVEVCRELLKYRLSGISNLWVNTRLIMADSLLMLGRTAEAYEALRPVHDTSLSLADRMKLLPIQLRYELAADHSSAALQSLPEKLRIAQLLDAPRASLVHALLAEASRRLNRGEEYAFLSERAWLYHDVDQLAARYPLIAPVAATKP